MLSVVLPVLNEGDEIGRVLHEVYGQIEPPGGYEVLVVDGGSSDRTRRVVEELAAEHSNLRLIENPRKLSSAGRNAGVRAAHGSYVLFLDGHCSIPGIDYFVRVVELFRTTGASCLCRPQHLIALADSNWARAVAAARHSRLGHNYRSDIYGGPAGFTNPRSAGAAYKRDCFEQLGGYDERFDACEDVEFNHRVAEAGLSAFRHPDLRIDYRPRSGLRPLFHQMFRYGRGRARLMALHPSLVPWPLLVMTGILAVAAVAFAHGGAKLLVLLLGVPIGVWMLVISAESFRLHRGSPAPAARTALAFVVIYAGLLAGFWRGSLEMRRFRESPSRAALSATVERSS